MDVVTYFYIKSQNGKHIVIVSFHNGIDHVESPDGEHNDPSPHAYGSCIPISNVANAELIVAGDKIEARLRQQMV